MQDFIEALENKTNVARTEKGAEARATSGSDVVDLFAKGGALRTRPYSDVRAIFSRAWSEDKLLALKCAFFLRDIRGGQGERRTFRMILHYLAKKHLPVVKKNIHLVPEYGRWDDLYVMFYVSDKAWKVAAEFMQDQLERDLEAMQKGKSISLLAKWLKSEQASSDTSTRLARETAEFFGMTYSRYRKTLSKLREHLKVTERLMCQNRWEEIDYERVPSKASFIYNEAFKRHDPKGYEEFLDQVESGEKEIKAQTLYPYEIVRKALMGSHLLSQTEERTLDAQWDALPTYGDAEAGSLAVVDTSGSMYSNDMLPLAMAVSLGIYFGEHIGKGPFADKFITFSREPRLVKVKGDDITDRAVNVSKAEWGMNTDIEAVFALILQVARENDLNNDEIPQKLYIISDMEFDRCVHGAGRGRTLMEKIAKRYEEVGYDLPEIVFWRVDARTDQVPVMKDERGFQMVSGASPSLFRWVVDSDVTTAEELVRKVLSDERYAPISLP